MDIASRARRGYELFDRRRTLKEDGSLEQALREFLAEIESEQYARESIRSGIEGLENAVRGESAQTGAEPPLRKEWAPKDLDDWLFDLDDFSVSYSIRYDRKDLRYLSPGEKGVVLLVLYLEAEEGDNRPLIIDQPDDNLDNLSIYPTLVDYFRKRKNTRQIVIITHNPNLVVNADAEQIIVADFDGEASPRITYTAGALEAPAIRASVCKILEGGAEAFHKREEKYSLPPP